ncbi:MAG: ATP-binding protein, partial [Terriglobus roseus]|nr:ATP-binding protein [Terriglobus roseus]
MSRHILYTVPRGFRARPLPTCRSCGYTTVGIVPARRLNTQAPSPDPNPNPADDGFDEAASKGQKDSWKGTAFKMFEASMTTFASISALGLVGYSYTIYYKRRILNKMEHAFDPGDPVLELAAKGKSDSPTGLPDESGRYTEHWIARAEQEKIDAIVRGDDRGHYHLLIGEKGTGKSSMLIDAMFKVNGEGCAMFEAHADLEIFRVRLGKALDFEYHEDNIGSLFSIRGPREGGALLDIERAFNKLEKVAMKRRELQKRPVILIINSVHLLRDDHDGQDLLELIQQRAEQWAASNVCTVILNSDDYWVYERLKNYATRMQVTPVGDLTKQKAIYALKRYRLKYWGEKAHPAVLEKVYDKVGGRLNFLNRVAKAEDMLAVCDEINRTERTWFLNKLWILGEEMDDDVM